MLGRPLLCAWRARLSPPMGAHNCGYRWGQGLRVASRLASRPEEAWPLLCRRCLVPRVLSSVRLQVLGQELLCEAALISTVYAASSDSSSSTKSEAPTCLLLQDCWSQALPAFEPTRDHLSIQTAETPLGKDLRVGTRLGLQAAQMSSTQMSSTQELHTHTSLHPHSPGWETACTPISQMGKWRQGHRMAPGHTASGVTWP